MLLSEINTEPLAFFGIAGFTYEFATTEKLFMVAMFFFKLKI